MANLTAPDIGAKFVQGPLTAAILAKAKFQSISAFACYKANDDLKVAGTYEHGKSPKFGVGLAYNVQKGTTFKAKVQEDQSISCGVRHEVVKGFTVVAGGKVDSKGGKHSYGLQFSIE